MKPELLVLPLSSLSLHLSLYLPICVILGVTKYLPINSGADEKSPVSFLAPVNSLTGLKSFSGQVQGLDVGI